MYIKIQNEGYINYTDLKIYFQIHSPDFCNRKKNKEQNENQKSKNKGENKMKNSTTNKIGAGQKLAVLLILLISLFAFSGNVSAKNNEINTLTLKLTLKFYLEGFCDGGNHIIDTIKVFLAKGTYPYAFADSQLAVLSDSGTSYMEFTNAGAVNYYIVVKHRNHLETRSGSPQTFNTDKPLRHDFTKSESQAYNCNMLNRYGSWVLYSGDINHDGLINATDMLILDSAVFNYLQGYVDHDLNGDLFCDLFDFFILDSNIYKNVKVYRPSDGINPSSGRVGQEDSGMKNLAIEKTEFDKTVKEMKKNNPPTCSLSQNYPNPFNPVTKINYIITKQTTVSLKIYDMTGREVKTLVNEMKSPGSYTAEFNGSELSSGNYFYIIKAGDFAETKMMTLVK